MPAGPQKGECIDTSLRRSSIRLSLAQRRAFGIHADNSFVVANFLHQKRFWVAVIPYERVRDTVYMNFVMSKRLPLNHGEIRFRIGPGARPVRLIAQSKKSNRLEITLKEDIVFSEFGVRAPGHEQDAFSVIQGSTGRYAIAYVFQSLSESSKEALQKNEQVKQYRLNLNDREVGRALQVGGWLGNTYGTSQIYDTFSNSCLNTVFIVLYGVRDFVGGTVFSRVLENVGPIPMLRQEKFIGPGESSRIQDLNQEFKNSSNLEN